VDADLSLPTNNLATNKDIVISATAGTAPAGMCFILSGTFQMGSTVESSEQPVHSVTVSAFYMDTTEVTQADYLALMGVNPSNNTGDMNRPVERVTWFDAVLYCNKRSKRDGLDTVYSYTAITGTAGNGCTDLTGLTISLTKSGYRLPTEAEWEYACRAGTTTDYYWGRNYPPSTTADTLAMDNNAVWIHNSSMQTKPVAGKQPNAWGLYDASGNVLEWCNDWYGGYSSEAQSDPTGPTTGVFRCLRGGAALGFCQANELRSAYRLYASPHTQMPIGFRSVR
jgi:formylglycine-generating enzyme required for sulfatase activity